MTEREQAINRDLRALDDAHRLGRITRADYRARRRRVLQSLYDSSAIVTARKALVTPDALTAPRTQSRQARDGDTAGSGSALTALLSMRPAMAWWPLCALAAGVIILILLAWWLLRGQ